MHNKILEAILKGILMGLEIQDDELDLTIFQKSETTSRSYDDIKKEKKVIEMEASGKFNKDAVDYCKSNGLKITVDTPERLFSWFLESKDAYGDNCDLNWIDTSHITDMGQLFHRQLFNGNISKWDVSNVTNMNQMFSGSNFNGDISSWDVSKVENMGCMFAHCKFNGDISNWDVSNVDNMGAMFKGNLHFNRDISKWNVSKVTNMYKMFEDSNFDRDISMWDTRSVLAHKDMFKDCPISNYHKPGFTCKERYK